MFVDFHSHILPAADHGSDGIETSLLQIKNAAKAGVSTIVATPHFYMDHDTVDAFLERRERAYEALMKEDLCGIKIVKGAEVHIGTSIEILEGLEKLCIGDTKYILMELPREPWPYWIHEAMYKVSAMRRLLPICAHIDRYSSAGRHEILKMNVTVQINASAFLKRRDRKKYIDLICDDSVHLLGSDAHGDGELAYKDFSFAIKKLKGLSDPLMHNAEHILSSKR